MIRRRGDDTANKVDNVSATGSGQAVGINHGTVQQLHFHHEFRRLRDATIDLDPLPADLRLIDPQHTTVLAELAEIDASLTARIDAAAAMMTLAELAEFTGIPETELRAVGRRTGGSRSRRTARGKSVRGKSTTRAARSRRSAVAPLPADTDTNTDAVAADQSA